MKQQQTFKFDSEVIESLKKKASKAFIPFNRFVENILRDYLTKKK